MIGSKKVKIVSMVAFLLMWIFGEYLIDLFPPSTLGRVLSILFVGVVGGVSGYIFFFTKTEEDISRWCFSADKAANCPHCGGAVIADIYIDPERRRVDSLELIDFSLYRDKPKGEGR